MDKKANTFLLLLALCVVIIIAIMIWLTQNKPQPVPTLSQNAGTDEMLQQLQATQDDGGASDLDQLQNEALDL